VSKSTKRIFREPQTTVEVTQDETLSTGITRSLHDTVQLLDTIKKGFFAQTRCQIVHANPELLLHSTVDRELGSLKRSGFVKFITTPHTDPKTIGKLHRVLENLYHLSPLRLHKETNTMAIFIHPATAAGAGSQRLLKKVISRRTQFGCGLATVGLDNGKNSGGNLCTFPERQKEGRDSVCVEETNLKRKSFLRLSRSQRGKGVH
jgi:hypothetical protein